MRVRSHDAARPLIERLLSGDHIVRVSPEELAADTQQVGAAASFVSFVSFVSLLSSFARICACLFARCFVFPAPSPLGCLLRPFLSFPYLFVRLGLVSVPSLFVSSLRPPARFGVVGRHAVGWPPASVRARAMPQSPRGAVRAEC